MKGDFSDPARRARRGAFLAPVLAALLSLAPAHAPAADLEIRVYNAKASGIGELSALVLGEREAVLIDSQWLLSDGRALARMIGETGRTLTHVLLTHGHPDHYMGLGPVIDRFPDAKVLARQPIVDEIATQFPAKWVHWEPMYGDELPVEPVVPELLEGDAIELEGHEIRFVDMPPAETMDATAYYIPSAKALVAGDIVFSKMHAYFADLNNPTGWIAALEKLRNVGPIETVYPGHGPVGGPALLDEQIAYLRTYRSLAGPGVPLREFAPKMMARYPDHGGAILLWWTRGPGFGIFGPRALGVPDALLRELPPHLLEGRSAPE